MTTPAAPQQQPPQGQQPPPPPPADLDDPALAIAVAAVLAGTLGPGITVAATVAALKVRFALTAAAVTALGAVLNVVMASPPPVTGVIGAASEQTSRMNAARRAQYVIAAAKRVMGAVVEARSKGLPVGAAIRDQLARERKFYEQHQQAMWNRAAAAGKIDMEAATHGNLLGWYARRNDGRTTPECQAADRHNFYVTPPPNIGLPGIGPHAGCRCEPGPPWRGGKLLPTRGLKFARAA
jgi:hypothetical protein